MEDAMQRNNRTKDSSERERGAAMFVMTVSVVVAAGLATSLLVVATGRSRATEARKGMETAMAVAEAGLARGAAETNKFANRLVPAWPGSAGFSITGGPNGEIRDANDPGNASKVFGRFQVSVKNGRYDLLDNDGDGTSDEVDEDIYVFCQSMGYYGQVDSKNPYKVKVEAQFKKAMINVNGALTLDDPSPNVDISPSAAFNISGKDHDIYTQNPIAGNPGLPGLTAMGPFDATDSVDVAGKVATGQINGTPTAVQAPLPADNVDIDAIVAYARRYADVTTSGVLGGYLPKNGSAAERALEDWKITYHNTDQSFSGNERGAGIWVVDGNLEWAGNCAFGGILIVTGQLTIKGGGSGKMLMGTVIVGGKANIDFTNNGTTDIRYSKGAVDKAQAAGIRYAQVAWRQITTN
jgi:hypothetical protein